MGLLKRNDDGPSGRERAQLRRRLRELGSSREELLRDVGGLVIEMQRRDRIDKGTLWERASKLAGVDDEIREVQQALGEDEGTSELSLGDDKATRALDSAEK